MDLLKILIPLSCLLVLLQSCSEEPYACTDEFVTYTVTVLAPDGEPADSVRIEVREEDEEIYPCDEFLCDELQTGSYIIMHDGFFDELTKTGEVILVEGTKGDFHFEEEYVFGRDKCHVQKLAGPDTVSFTLE